MFQEFSSSQKQVSSIRQFGKSFHPQQISVTRHVCAAFRCLSLFKRGEARYQTVSMFTQSEDAQTRRYQHIQVEKQTTTFPDRHMKERDRNQGESRSHTRKSGIVCGGSTPVNSPEKPGSETQRLRGEGGCNDMLKLINKCIFSHSYCVFPKRMSFKE